MISDITKRTVTCNCGSNVYYKDRNYRMEGSYSDLPPVWLCTNCGTMTPRTEFKPRNEGEFTPAQQRMLNNIGVNYVVTNAEWAGFRGRVWVRFSNNESQPLTKETFFGYISFDGRLTIHQADYLGASEEGRKAIAGIAKYGIQGRVSVQID